VVNSTDNSQKYTTRCTSPEICEILFQRYGTTQRYRRYFQRHRNPSVLPILPVQSGDIRDIIPVQAIDRYNITFHKINNHFGVPPTHLSIPDTEMNEYSFQRYFLQVVPLNSYPRVVSILHISPSGSSHSVISQNSSSMVFFLHGVLLQYFSHLFHLLFSISSTVQFAVVPDSEGGRETEYEYLQQYQEIPRIPGNTTTLNEELLISPGISDSTSSDDQNEIYQPQKIHVNQNEIQILSEIQNLQEILQMGLISLIFLS